MSERRVERRLAAILAVDVAGYSRLMGEDEEGTLAALRAVRRELSDPKIAEHRGRIVKTTGDGLLVEFASVVDAVRCAVEVQREMIARNAASPAERRIEFRIGINVGDIIIEDGDIFGDGVNVAARLEVLAEPGGICVSAAVHDQVQGRLYCVFEDMGEQNLKNIARPVRVYRIRADHGVAPRPSPKLALPDKPSIAVLPFVNMSSDHEQEYFGDGIAEDVITALSRYPSLFVIARNSCFTYKGRSVEVRQIGRELGVRYVLEGSLRKSGNRIRVTAQLVEAETGNHVWAERYDRDLNDIFVVQDEISEAVTIAITPAVAQAEQRRAMRKSPANLDAWAAYQRGLWHAGKGNDEDNELAKAFFRQAIDLDPGFTGGYKGLASAYAAEASIYHRERQPELQLLREELARKAIALDPGDAEAHVRLASALRNRGDPEGAMAEIECALALCPNLATAQGIRGAALIHSGRSAEGLAALELAVRLDPRDPSVPTWLSQIALGFYLCRNYVAAVEAAKRANRMYPDFPYACRILAAALGQLEIAGEAKEALEKAVAIGPASFETYVRRRPPHMRPEDYEHVVDGLRKAGWRA
jgi:adenylate cyclase